MQEGPADIYQRARRIFFNSVMDGIGKADSAADYYFALINLQRHDGIIKMDEIDVMLQNMIGPILKDEQDAWEQAERLRQFQQMEQSQPLQEWEAQRHPIQNLTEAGTAIPIPPNQTILDEHIAFGATAGPDWTPHGAPNVEIEQLWDPAGMALDDHHWKGRVREPEHPDLAGRSWISMLHPKAAGYSDSQGYEYEDLMGPDFHPLHEGYDYNNPKEGTYPPWTQLALDYVLPPEGGGDSIAQITAQKEQAWQDYHMKHPDFVGKRHPIFGTSSGNLNFLGIMEPFQSEHEFYERDYQNWLTQSDALSSHPDIANLPVLEQDAALRRMHGEHKRKEWLSDEVIEEGGRKHRVGMGPKDYHGGLLFGFTPQERTAIYDHINEHSTDNPAKAHVKGAHNYNMGRFKRSQLPRYMAEYEYMSRTTGMVGPPVENKPISIGSANIRPKDLRLGLSHHDETSLLSNYRTHLVAQSEDWDDLTPERKKVQHAIWDKQAGGIPNVDGNQLIPTKVGEDENLNARTLYALAGVDSKTQEYYPENKHPHFPHWPYTTKIKTDEETGKQKEVRVPLNAHMPADRPKQILEEVADDAQQMYRARHMQNALQMYLSHYVSPLHHPTEYTGGDNTTFLTHHANLFRGIGGMGRNPNIMPELYHDNAVHGKEGDYTHSIYGTKYNIKPKQLEAMDALEEGEAKTKIHGRNLFGERNLSFQPHDGNIGLMGPFTSVAPERESKSATNVKIDPDTGEVVSTPWKQVSYLTPPPAQMVNQWNTRFGPRAAAAKGNVATMGNGLDGPTLNAMHTNYHENYVNRTTRQSGHQALTKGIYSDGRDSYAKLHNVFTHMPKPFAGMSTLDKHHAQNEIRRGAQNGFHRPPMDPQEGFIPFDALEDRHIPMLGGMNRLSEFMGTSKRTVGEGGLGKPLPKLYQGWSDKEHQANQISEEIGRTKHRLASNPELRERLGEELHILYDQMEEREDALEQMHAPGIRELGSGGQVTGLPEQKYHSADEKYQHDLKAIWPMYHKLKQQAKLDGHSIEHEDPDVYMGNIQALVAAATTAINRSNPRDHGITSLGTARHEKERSVLGGGDPQEQIKRHVHENGKGLSGEDSIQHIGTMLGLDMTDENHKKSVVHLKKQLQDMALDAGDAHLQFPVMKVEDAIKDLPEVGGHEFADDHDLSGTLKELLSTSKFHRGGGRGSSNITTKWNAMPEMRTQSMIRQYLGEGKKNTGALQKELGLHWVGAHHRDLQPHPATSPHDTPHTPVNMLSVVAKINRLKQQKVISPNTKLSSGNKSDIKAYNGLQALESFLVSHPHTEPKKITSTKSEEYGTVQVPIGHAGKPHGHAIHSTYDSPGTRMNMAYSRPVSVEPIVGHDGKVSFRSHSVPIRKKLLTLTKNMIRGIGEHQILPHLGPHNTPVPREHLPAQLRPNDIGETPQMRGPHTLGKAATMLASLTNPDVLLKVDIDKPPPLQPMHRIFEPKDLEHLKGFSGDWVVTLMPEGVRHFIRRKGDDIEAWQAIGGEADISDENKKSLKKTTDKDFLIDTIYVGDECHVFDILEFDDKDVNDMASQERMKIMRGGMESHEKILLPAAYNTRLTDDAGLESTIESLQKEGERILLRDAQSTYMVGEKRHPKWVLLQPGQDVNLIILERKGSGPYTYRLGTGPVSHDEDEDDRIVELDGDPYMDVGTTFRDEEKYEVGDHVKVNVDSVTSSGEDEDKMYTIHAGNIEDEAEGEALASLDTLDTMTKSECIHWPHEIGRGAFHIQIKFPLGDIVYKTTQRNGQWMVHSPQGDNRWLLRMAESQRPFWAPIAGLILKADLDMVEQKAEVHESEGEGEPLIPPKKVKNTDHWKKMVEALKGVEKAVGSFGHASSGAAGLGIDYATPIQSPHGPTENTDAQGMPDYDSVKRPSEDPEEPYNKVGKKPQSIDLTLESEEEVGHLHVDEEDAVLHI